MPADDRKLPSKAVRADVAAFLQKVRTMPAVSAGPGRKGRLLFAMDATASRQPSWDRACHLQAEMFLATRDLGGLAISLVYYRGFGEFMATPWLTDTDDLLARMTGVQCLGGQTQIEQVMLHAIAETRRERIHALVFVGDMVEEDVDRLCHLAGELGLLGVPGFFFHEGGEPLAARCFQQMAKLSGGAYHAFDAHSADVLRELLRAVAVYAAGGQKALAAIAGRKGGATARIAAQLALPGPKR